MKEPTGKGPIESHPVHMKATEAKLLTFLRMGRWGNGDVDVPLAAVEDVPYVIGLVRQAFEKQMEPDA